MDFLLRVFFHVSLDKQTECFLHLIRILNLYFLFVLVIPTFLPVQTVFLLGESRGMGCVHSRYCFRG